MALSILVTGADGQLGKTLKDIFKGTDLEDLVLYANRQELDISSQTDIDNLFGSHSFEYCINCAGYTKVEDAELNKEKAFRVNSEGAQNLAMACKNNNTTLIHLSTDYVFDGESKRPYEINHKTNPINIYGQSKLDGENKIKQELNNYFIIRTSWLYSVYAPNFFTTVVNKVQNNMAMKVINNQTGTPTSCNELARFIVFLIKQKVTSYGTYHFACLGHTTWYGFAKAIENFYKPNSNQLIVSTENFPTKAKRPKYSVLNLENTTTKYNVIKTWKAALVEVVAQYKSKNNIVD